MGKKAGHAAADDRHTSKGKDKARNSVKKSKKKSKKSSDKVRTSVTASSASGSAARTHADPLKAAMGLISAADKLVLVRIPATLDPACLQGVTVSLDAPCEVKGRGGERLQSRAETVGSASSGAGRPVVVCRGNEGSDLRVAGHFDHRMTITESARVAPAKLPDHMAVGAVAATHVNQLSNLDFRYVPFGASLPTGAGAGAGSGRATTGKRNREQEDDGNGVEADGAHKKKAKKDKKSKKKKSKKLKKEKL
eukprot:m.123905 g.123905  ORF g.123905 m.123905 type:complete len:251 (-) comp11136_c1_seq4:1444-2196(-)